MDVVYNNEIYGTNLLHQAALHGRSDYVAKILELGADVNMTTKSEKYNVLHLAAMSKSDSEMKTNVFCSYIRSVSIQGQEVEDREYVPDTLKQFVNRQTWNDCVAIHVACRTNNAGVIRLLFDAGGDVNARDYLGETPLHVAVKSSSVECLNILLEANAMVDVVNADKQTPLICSNQTHTDIVKALVEAGSDINHADRNGRTGMHIAAKCGDVDTVRYLCKKGVDINATDIHGQTSLMLVALYEEVDILKLLCEMGARLDIRDNAGETVLHKTVWTEVDAAEKLLYLLEGQNVPIDALDNRGRTALFPAVEFGDVELLCQKGFDLQTRDIHGTSLLHASCKPGLGDVNNRRMVTAC
ncbi:serine/threonine-protein phosphatase 6 regulatory ankyrin repeat subunit B-like [Haliotis rufescens]|uniref:serine/threonine-protein phosphatase 6 regulatory ankyrin repeat subunit B-like n=1 Tax=Haliotis rufescens TaxID=6454 RepID=UPI00201E8AF7|nr:serine/threonine-protein phosphatase 6 regulatory ankyrin repeat subunit B-like [Haliotis rufescens]